MHNIQFIIIQQIKKHNFNPKPKSKQIRILNREKKNEKGGAGTDRNFGLSPIFIYPRDDKPTRLVFRKRNYESMKP